MFPKNQKRQVSRRSLGGQDKEYLKFEEVLNRAWASHEFAADYIEEVADFLVDGVKPLKEKIANPQLLRATGGAASASSGGSGSLSEKNYVIDPHG